jgi:hypothetical protein
VGLRAGVSPARYTTDDLESSLLDVSDLPGGWVPESADEENSIEDDHTEAPCGLGAGLGKLGGTGEFASAGASFTLDERIGPGLLVSLREFPAGAAADAIELIEHAFAECEPYRHDGGTFTPGLLDFPRLGDGSVAIRIGVERKGLRGEAAMVFVVHGTVIIYVAVTTVSQNAVPLLQEIAPIAVAKAESKLS